MISQNIGYSTNEVQRFLIMLTAKHRFQRLSRSSFHECLLLKLHSNGNNA